MKVITPSPFREKALQKWQFTCDNCYAVLELTAEDLKISYHAGYADQREQSDPSYSVTITCADCGRTLGVDLEDEPLVRFLYQQRGK